MFLEECKYVVKEEKKYNFINDNIKISSDDSDQKNSDEENANEKNQIHVFFCFFCCFFLRKYKCPPEISEYFNLGAENVRKFSFLKYKKFFWVSVS